MKIAIPTMGGRLSSHFGHCEAFTLFETDAQGEILERIELTPPSHEPGVLPRWLKTQGVETVIAGGMGMRAQNLFAEQGMQVCVGAADDELETLVKAFLAGTLRAGANPCDH